MAGIIEFVTKYYTLILTVLAAVAGLLLMLGGLGTFRRFYSPMCAILGLAMGLALHAAFPRDEMYLVAAMISIACGVIGYENYRCGIVLASALAAFEASAVFVMRRINEDISLVIADAGVRFEPGKASMLRLWYMRLKYEGDMKEAMSIVYKEESIYTLNKVMKGFGDAVDMLQIGLGVSVIIGVFAGLLSIILTDYVVIASTAALGSVMLVGIIDETEFLWQIQYNYKLTIFFIGAVVFQVARYYKSIEELKQKKKRRGLYEKKR